MFFNRLQRREIIIEISWLAAVEAATQFVTLLNIHLISNIERYVLTPSIGIARSSLSA
jgi:hypothetical protein